MIRIFSVGIRSIPHLEVFLGTTVGFGLATDAKQTIDAVAGWGLRASAKKAIRYARQMELPYLALEDGFLRSLELGQKDPPLSIVVDDLGIYYDATRASRLEALVGQTLSPDQIQRAQTVISLWRDGRVSKYNHLRESRSHRSVSLQPSPSTAGDAMPTDRPVAERFVLVVDQTMGDASIKYGQANEASFQRMLQAALTENPDCTVVLKIHPDVCAGKKRGHFDVAAVSRNPRVKVLAEDVHPVGIIEHAEAVYAVTSQMGFEGLLWGKPVRTFGMPFYAGWGLTNDELPAPERRGRATLEQLVHAALIEYPRYVNPETGRGCEVEEILAYLALQRRMRERFSPHIHAVGISAYKRAAVRRFFSGSEVCFKHNSDAVPAGETVAVWGCNEPLSAANTMLSTSPHRSNEVVHLEDGFLRSIGLGAELVRPLSWVMDRRGIYFDASRPSDLEHLLQTSEFDARMRARAARLRTRIVAEGLTKYNVGAGKCPGSRGQREYNTDGRGETTGQRLILVPGQVETDASIRYGAASVHTNIGLLRAVRAANPDAYIVYKPHPDVVSGLRAAGSGEEDACSLCDEIVEDVSIHELLAQVDEVHVLTSLTGFEALLRGKSVTTYGQPFYAGWGLTRDLALTPEVAQRRTRRLQMDELVAGVLIFYPTYVSRTTGRFTTPERAIDELVSWREREAKGTPLWRLPLRIILRAWGGRR